MFYCLRVKRKGIVVGFDTLFRVHVKKVVYKMS